MLFFVFSGANLDLTIFASNYVVILLVIGLTYLTFRIIGKYIGALGGCIISKCESSVKKYLGLTLIPQAGVAIGLSTSAANSLGGSELGSLIVASILLSTIIYELIGPAITKFSLVKAGEIAPENI
jgi:Kef-type K+ transport system membrane component KefB